MIAPEVVGRDVDVGDAAARTAERRARFRDAIQRVSTRRSSADLVRWVLIPGSIAILVGFALIVFAWVGAARTHRQIEQLPYLISGGLTGLALVFLGGLLLASAVWIVLLRSFTDEAVERSRAVEVVVLEERVAELEAALASADGPKPRRRARASKNP